MDAAGRLASIARDLAGTSADVTTTLGYNRAGQLASETRSNDAYAFDGLYNVDRSYSANGLNQYTAAGPASFSYDANGNLTASTAPNASGTPVTTSYVYDVENRLVSVSGGGSGALRYDPLGRLYEITEGGGTTRLLYDGDALVGEYAINGSILRRYAHGVGAGDDPIAWYEGAGLSSSSRRYLYADRLGSITNVVSNSGASIAINTFDEYGIPGAVNEGRFQYTGQAFLEGIGLYHYKARMYSPNLGRFMQTDPIGYADGMNWYNYVGSDPVNWADPTGLCKEGQENCVIVKGARAQDPCPRRWTCVSRKDFLDLYGGWTDWFSAPEWDGWDHVMYQDNTVKPQREQSPCAQALLQEGRIEYGGNTGTLVALAGFEGSWGEWRNLDTGSHGDYFSVGGGVGAGVGLTRDYGFARSLADFVGYGETLSAGGAIGPFGGGYSATQNARGDWISRGGSVGLLSKSIFNWRNLSAAATATAGETFIRNCHVQGN